MVDTAFATISVARGDMLHRKSLRWGIAALLGLLALLPCTIWARTILMTLANFGPLGFKIGASAWALVLAVGLIAFVCGGLTALFLRVEASVNARSRRRLAGDLLAALLVMIITFAPTIVALYPPVHALFTHSIGFRGLGQQYPRAEDPYGYWQAVAFWFMGAATLGYLACVYWRWKWRQYKGLQAVALEMEG